MYSEVNEGRLVHFAECRTVLSLRGRSFLSPDIRLECFSENSENFEAKNQREKHPDVECQEGEKTNNNCNKFQRVSLNSSGNYFIC